LFDDTTFDDYSCEEWIAKKIDEDGSEKLMPGQGWFQDEGGRINYRPLWIDNYNA
jgi:hypothetical protein